MKKISFIAIKTSRRKIILQLMKNLSRIVIVIVVIVIPANVMSK